ncbi:MAG: hypothetical protein M0Q53_07965 [Prolixibacteraceae bacterium]|jgi:hypothetical protein|nr:hypothetical protein [Prolixibacteraceae bacterium]
MFDLKGKLSRNLINIPGWRTNRRIVVIESDDWGSIRMPSREVYESMLKAGIGVDKCPYNKYDSLASESDLDALFNVLVKFKDKNGNHPILTANTVMANPDFQKIRESGFKEYHYELFTETFKKYPNHQNSFYLWGKGMEEKIFHPQFHGREHVNVNLWMHLLHNKQKAFLKAFDYGFWGLGPSIVHVGARRNIQASFDASDQAEIEQHSLFIKDGLGLFHNLFGYKSQSFIANNFIWASELNKTLKENEVTILQGMKYQLLPILSQTRRQKIRHVLGELNDQKQTYLIRNCAFEPSQYPTFDNVNNCLKDISTAFFWKKPAIISSHRLNYIGYINEKNLIMNLRDLEKLFVNILKEWPEVEFMTSDRLGECISSDDQFSNRTF